MIKKKQIYRFLSQSYILQFILRWTLDFLKSPLFLSELISKFFNNKKHRIIYLIEFKYGIVQIFGILNTDKNP